MDFLPRFLVSRSCSLGARGGGCHEPHSGSHWPPAPPLRETAGLGELKKNPPFTALGLFFFFSEPRDNEAEIKNPFPTPRAAGHSPTEPL